MVSGIVIAALSGGIGGALGAALGAVVDKARGGPKTGADGKPRRTWTGTVGVFGGIIGAQLGVHVFTPMMQPPIEQRLANATPQFRVLHDHYPVEFQKIVSAFKASPNITAAELRPTVLPIIKGIITSHASQIDAQSAGKMYQLSVDEGGAMGAVDAQSCVALLNSRPTRTPLAEVLSPALKERDIAVSAEVLEQIATRPAPPSQPLTSKEAEKLGAAAASSLTPAEREVVGPALENLGKPMTDLQAQAACKFTIAMFKQALASSPETIRRLAVTK